MTLHRNMLCYPVPIFQRERRFNQKENFDKAVRSSDTCGFHLQYLSFNSSESESDFDGVTVRYATRMPKRENVLESEGSFYLRKLKQCQHKYRFKTLYTLKINDKFCPALLQLYSLWGGGIKITILVQSFLVYITIIMNKFFFQMYRSRHGQVLAFSHGP